MLRRLINIPLLLVVMSINTSWYISPCSAESEQIVYPDIKWEPKTHTFAHGYDPRYIDYENGDDNNVGTREKPWQHHPWDKAARGRAAECRGVHTYIFRNGIGYRGSLVATESGEKGNPIQLTADPSWGNGKASIYGSVKIKKGWKRCNEGECPEISNEVRNDTWYIDLKKSVIPRMLWEIHGGKINRIPIARTPNWEIVDRDDPRSKWWELTGYFLEVKIYLDKTDGFKLGDKITGTGKWTDFDENKDNLRKGNNRITEVTKDYIKIDSWNWKQGEIKVGAKITNGRAWAKVINMSSYHDVISRLVDSNHFSQNDPNYWVGATMWSEKESQPKPDAEKIIGYNPKEHSVRINFHRGTDKGPRKYDRYYLENLPKFLDNPGEYYYAEKRKHARRLFIRLPEDRDPNNSVIEAAKNDVLLDINNQSNITIAGLDLKFSNNIACCGKRSRHASMYAAAIRLKGSCSNIKIMNMEISHVSNGVVAIPEKKDDLLDFIEVSDNILHDIDSTAIGLSNGKSHYQLKSLGARLVHVKVMRNRVSNIGYRVLSHNELGRQAVHIEGGELVEVARNTVDQTWGAGILAFNGADYSKGNIERPLMRSLIHHNKVTNSLLGFQDYGGIASWMGGPSYVYSNISGNPVGYKNAHYRRLKRKGWYRTSCFGVGIYFDSQYKGYVFNNIMWGQNNNVNDRIYNSVAFNEAMGFMNLVFNNTMYQFGVGLHKGMFQHNRCYYIGNLILDIGHKFIQHEPNPSVIEYNSLAYAKNVFQGVPSKFGQLGRNVFSTLDKMKKRIIENKVMVAQTGEVVREPQVLSAETHDFRLKDGSIAIDKGAKVFVPWGLYGVVGEWNFFYHPYDPTVILGENVNWNNEWFRREMFQDIPRNDLKAHNIDKSNFTQGILENWIEGALRLNGKNQYLDISDDILKKGYNWSAIRCRRKPCTGYYEGLKRVSLDMDTNNFLVEVVFKSVDGIVEGGIVSKRTHKGYSLEIEKDGSLILTLDFGESECSRLSKDRIHDGKWHHVIAEVDRSKPEGINIYIDGKLSNGKFRGHLNDTESLSNTSNFVVGKTLDTHSKYFKGIIDFLRISRGTLRDAETSIEELYSWEFDGPFLKDFVGNPVQGRYRDVGAMEFKKNS